MESINNLIEEIKKSFNNKEYELMNKYINQLFKKIGSKAFALINSIELNEKEKFLYLMKISYNENLRGLDDRLLNYILEYINNNSNKFFDWITDDEIQNEFVVWFKKNTYLICYTLKEEILTKIFKLPKIQENVLLDLEFFKHKNSIKFYKSLPQEFGFLISFYVNYDLKEYERDLEQLYNKFFSNNINQIGRLNFIKEQIKISQKDDIFDLGFLSSFYDMLYLSYVLKKINENKKYYTIVQNLIILTHLTIGDISKFLYKYEKAPFLREILSKTSFDKETIKKIKFLSFENRLIDYKNINSLDNFSLIELKNIAKEKNTNIKLQIYGGPTGSTEEKLFLGGYETEIRRINYDGSIEVVDAEEGHDLAIELAYPEIDFDENCVMAGERAAEASRKLSCITLLIENERCLIVANKNISNEQIETLKKLKLVNEKNAKFGIFEVNEENNDLIPVYVEEVDFYKMIEYMETLNKKIKL